MIAGPLRDRTILLHSAEVPVGRDPGNVVAISDPSLSRRHCALVRDEAGYSIRDLESRNGTFVNGAAVTESRLQHGDQVSVGDSVFVFLVREEVEEPASHVEFEEGTTHATAQLRPQDVLYLQPDRVLSELPATSRVARNLNALLKISRVVHAIRDLEQLQAQILNLIFEVAPADRGAILLDGHGSERFASIFARHRLPHSTQPVRVSRTIARQVLEQGVAILGADISRTGGLSDVDSIVKSNIHSLLCVPLTVFQKVIGCIYVDSTNPGIHFDMDHLELVAAIAGISAVALENARRLQWLEQENLRLNTEINLEHNMVGEGARMKEVYQFLSRVAPIDSTVLIHGESGTGKELAARAIHRNSPRAAITGAVAQKKGRLEMADGGVVFLDEIGELAPALQVKLLRVLQEREIERLGGTRPISVDVRLIAASNRDLEEAIHAGTFRRDLFFRLNVVTLVMPPLRERREDIPTLAQYFVSKCSAKCKLKPKQISPDAMACLANYDWPGNVRELENAMERALVLGSSEVILPEDLPESVLEKEPPPGIVPAKYHAAVKELKKNLIVNALEQARGNYTEAARILGVHANYLHRLIRNFELRGVIRSFPSARTGTGSGSRS